MTASFFFVSSGRIFRSFFKRTNLELFVQTHLGDQLIGTVLRGYDLGVGYGLRCDRRRWDVRLGLGQPEIRFMVSAFLGSSSNVRSVRPFSRIGRHENLKTGRPGRPVPASCSSGISRTNVRNPSKPTPSLVKRICFGSNSMRI
jgi:hypothetical protein